MALEIIRYVANTIVYLMIYYFSALLLLSRIRDAIVSAAEIDFIQFYTVFNYFSG